MARQRVSDAEDVAGGGGGMLLIAKLLSGSLPGALKPLCLILNFMTSLHSVFQHHLTQG